jgi:hypothetical protein
MLPGWETPRGELIRRRSGAFAVVHHLEAVGLSFMLADCLLDDPGQPRPVSFDHHAGDPAVKLGSAVWAQVNPDLPGPIHAPIGHDLPVDAEGAPALASRVVEVTAAGHERGSGAGAIGVEPPCQARVGAGHPIRCAVARREGERRR